MFKKMPFILLVIIAITMLMGQSIPLSIKQNIYACSFLIKSILSALLPLIIFGLLFKAAVNLAHNATRIIGLIFIFVCCSNFVATFLSHYVGMWVYTFDLSLLLPKDAQGLTAAWTLDLPRLIANNYAMMLGLICGIGFGMLKTDIVPKVISFLDRVLAKILGALTYFIPLFVAGFIVKLQHDGVVYTIMKDYTKIFAIIVVAQFGYIFLLYLALSKGNVKACLRSIRNMLPAAITGFSSMSSAAAMPLTIIGAENNAEDKDIARSVIPATVNIHLIGDCFAIPIFAYAVLKNFGAAEPTLFNYLIFTFYFVLAKFSVAAIPGGGIIVMLPILERYLGFNDAMMSLITALYILFDPVITCANVLGNGAFAKGIDRICAKRDHTVKVS